MSEQIRFETHLFSPRWRIDCNYQVRLEMHRMIIGRIPDLAPAICFLDECGKPAWSCDGEELAGRNPIVVKLQSELIQPPVVFVPSLEAAWRAWRNGVLDDEQVQHEISILFEWANMTTFIRPSSDFWKKMF